MTLYNFEGHQLIRPSKTTVDGTRSVLTKKVSIIIPSAKPNPTLLISDEPEIAPSMAKTIKVPAKINPAEVTVVPVVESALDTACLKVKP